MLLVQPTAEAGSNVVFLRFVFLHFCSLILRDFLTATFHLSSYPYGRRLVAWVDDEPALNVSGCQAHPLRGGVIVDERKTETADRVAMYQTDY